MAEPTAVLALQPIPILKGEINLKQWKRAVRQHATYFGILEHIETNLVLPEDATHIQKVTFTRSRVHAHMLLTSTIAPVEAQLEAAGWDDEDDSPHTLGSLIVKNIHKVSENSVTQLFRQFMNLKLEQGMLLRDFNAKFHRLLNRLAELDLVMPEKAKILMILEAVKTRYPEWHRSPLLDLPFSFNSFCGVHPERTLDRRCQTQNPASGQE
ncbi:Uu.00g136610.m01.CDS01 [Anthostomella pinea]|uniref:Uu.00g136610.m01.CDS01 n=1 Tax=Anthostomella pinea TaxID=933095 RepID=A0AAI8VPB5_9PEZI|nr:Uu.00g136610.m01.CDS01 [Anthostomella pinea]